MNGSKKKTKTGRTIVLFAEESSNVTCSSADETPKEVLARTKGKVIVLFVY